MEGSESEVREVHETSMVLSDAVLIYYGNCTEHWVRMRLLDLVKVPAGGAELTLTWLKPSRSVPRRRHTRRSCTSRRLSY